MPGDEARVTASIKSNFVGQQQLKELLGVTEDGNSAESIETRQKSDLSKEGNTITTAAGESYTDSPFGDFSNNGTTVRELLTALGHVHALPSPVLTASTDWEEPGRIRTVRSGMTLNAAQSSITGERCTSSSDSCFTSMLAKGYSHRLKVTQEGQATNFRSPIHSAYLIKRLVGRGGTGAVHLAQQKSSGYYRAIKKMKKTSAESTSRYRQELTMLRGFDHPRIIRLYETYEDWAHIYMVIMISVETCLLGYGILQWRRALRPHHGRRTDARAGGCLVDEADFVGSGLLSHQRGSSPRPQTRELLVS